MNSLRIRFAIGFSILFSISLTIALFIVYISYADFRKDEFFHRLKDKALTTFKLLLEVKGIDHDLLQAIDRNTLNSLYDEKVLIFEGEKIIYSSIDDKIIKYDPTLLSKVQEKKELHTMQDENELVGIYIEQNNKQYTILAAAYDNYGIRKMNFLKWTMFIVYFSGLAIGWVATYFFVKKVIRPLDTLKKDIQKISSSNLHTRLKQKGLGEEVNSLATNFNQMLERLQQSFSIQKDFVQYASHELRTPLAAMVGITENALNKKPDIEQYGKVLKQLFLQQQHLTEITNSLLLLSDNKVVNELELPLIRLDELVFRSVEIIQNLFPTASVQVDLEGKTSNEAYLLIHANELLLMMAFNNLLKNALQYSSDNKVSLTIRLLDTTREVQFKNKGKALTSEEEKMIFTPFYRAANAGVVQGHGLGLALVKQIAEMHKATVEYFREGDVNVFSFYFSQSSTY